MILVEDLKLIKKFNLLNKCTNHKMEIFKDGVNYKCSCGALLSIVPAIEHLEKNTNNKILHRDLIELMRKARYAHERYGESCDDSDLEEMNNAQLEILKMFDFYRSNNGEWETIETAPKTGEEFLVRYNNQGGVKELVSWNKIHGHWQTKGVAIVSLQATHWLKIPDYKG